MAADQLDTLAVLGLGEPEAAVLLVDLHPECAHLSQALEDVFAKLASLVDLVGDLEDPGKVIFELTRQDRAEDQNDLVPFWIFELENGHNVDRHILALPLSRDREHLKNLHKTMVAYRMVLGQPRQEDLVQYLEDRLGVDLKPEDLLKYRIDLSPPARTEMAGRNELDNLPEAR